jgi:hypothetical protein
MKYVEKVIWICEMISFVGLPGYVGWPSTFQLYEDSCMFLEEMEVGMLVVQEPAGGHGCHSGHMVLVDISGVSGVRHVMCTFKSTLPVLTKQAFLAKLKTLITRPNEELERF